MEIQLIEKLKTYYIVGGMPEAVYSWVNEKDIENNFYFYRDDRDQYYEDLCKNI